MKYEDLTASARLDLDNLFGFDSPDEPLCDRCGGEISDGECVECGELAECR
jgi:hypothetical protein